MITFSDEERREFFTKHIPHRMTALLSCIRRQQSSPAYFQGKGDIYCASIEGGFIMLRVFIEFLGVQSATRGGDLRLVQRSRENAKNIRASRNTDVMIDCFGLPLAKPEDFDPDQDLISRVHDGLSKATAHFTYKTNHFFDSEHDFIPAVNRVLNVLDSKFFKPLKEECNVHIDLPR